MTANQLKRESSSTEPEFRAYRKRLLYGSQALCLLGLVCGFLMDLPYVMGLSVIGLLVSYFKLSTLDN